MLTVLTDERLELMCGFHRPLRVDSASFVCQFDNNTDVIFRT